ncbi:hydroxyacid dehydrogenase [Thalassospira profundimaris]|uniref:Hydroxyacid dehydrogenase n=1 Tax=Thalassospira profundimaris TaxID=502049 RepID=A0A367X850_9PROT|nr:hydroxyacid dehydrogenase [Thalassospira profundimaris]RCK49834.1 hydroxyacid dehydrogenase [Thalassospira profundimaris]
MTESVNILVTGPDLDQEASALIEKAGIHKIHTPPYPSDDVLIDHLTRYRPQGVISRMGKIGAHIMDAAPDLKVISKHGAGVDNIDVDAASKRGIAVVRAPGANALSVAEHTIALLLATVKQIVPLDRGLRDGRWEKAGFLGVEIAGKTLGLVGFGAIARHTARLASGLGLNVIAYDPMADEALFNTENIKRVATVEELLAISDIVSLHCPLLPATRHLINAQSLQSMNPQSYLINTARGGLIDEAALLPALQSGHIAGAGLDTFEQEPPAQNNPLMNERTVVVTPHVGGVTAGAGRRVGVLAVEGIIKLLDGEEIAQERIVNPEIFTTGKARLSKTALNA